MSLYTRIILLDILVNYVQKFPHHLCGNMLQLFDQQASFHYLPVKNLSHFQFSMTASWTVPSSEKGGQTLSPSLRFTIFTMNTFATKCDTLITKYLFQYLSVLFWNSQVIVEQLLWSMWKDSATKLPKGNIRSRFLWRWAGSTDNVAELEWWILISSSQARSKHRSCARHNHHFDCLF